MGEETLDMEAAAVISRCGFKHNWGCECFRRDPVVRAAVIADHRRRLARLRAEPRPRLP